MRLCICAMQDKIMVDMFVRSGKKILRCGYTTGSTATAASKAATKILLDKKKIDKINIETPKGIDLEIELNSINIEENFVEVSALKDAGDDFDVTDGIEIFAKAEFIKEGIVIEAKEGIGKVTKSGLSVEVLKPAINPTPLKMIKKEINKILPKGVGVKITLRVPKGEEISKKTFNSRLGIVGGISIIGTSGIVYPMSEDALKETIEVEIKQKRRKRLVLTFGNIGENVCKSLGFKEDEIVIISNYVGFSLETCILEGVEEIILVGHIGKMSKIAYGCFNTHSRVSGVRLEVLALELALLNYPIDLVKKVLEEKTTEGAVKLLGDDHYDLYENIGLKILNQIDTFCYKELKSDIVMYFGYSDFKILYNSLEKKL